MAFFNKVMYLSYGNGGTTGFYALPKRLPSTAYAVGAIVREFTTASIGNERAYLCVLAGTTSSCRRWSVGLLAPLSADNGRHRLMVRVLGASRG